jgi:hypothetical protein
MALPEPYNLGRNLGPARTLEREARAYGERVGRACYFYEQALNAGHAPIGAQAWRFRHRRYQSPHE